MRTDSPPATLLAAAALVGLQGLLIVVAGGYIAVSGVVGNPTSARNAEIAAFLILVAGGGLLFVARGLARARRWSRAPAVLAQILAIPVGWSAVQGGRAEVGVPSLAVALVVLVLVLLPSAGAELEGQG